MKRSGTGGRSSQVLCGLSVRSWRRKPLWAMPLLTATLFGASFFLIKLPIYDIPPDGSLPTGEGDRLAAAAIMLGAAGRHGVAIAQSPRHPDLEFTSVLI